jgi:hypothetical protein
MSDDRPEESAASEPTPEPTPPSDTDQVVDNWFNNHIRGSAVGRNTEAWNHLMSVIDRLKEDLRKL